MHGRSSGLSVAAVALARPHDRRDCEIPISLGLSGPSAHARRSARKHGATTCSIHMKANCPKTGTQAKAGQEPERWTTRLSAPLRFQVFDRADRDLHAARENLAESREKKRICEEETVAAKAIPLERDPTPAYAAPKRGALDYSREVRR